MLLQQSCCSHTDGRSVCMSHCSSAGLAAGAVGVAAAAAALLSVLAFLSAVQAQCHIYTVRQGWVCSVLQNNLCEILKVQRSSS